MTTPTLLVFGFAAAIFVVNGIACLKVARSDDATRKQKILQILIVWILPIVGALLVFALTQNNLPAPSRANRDTVREDHNIFGD
jgi:uncharacterized BrkB/YihY/UPF0761 family membrane protein